MVTREDLFAMLQACGILPTDKVTIHCSLRAIGPIEGGADGLIDSFCAYLQEGLFLVPTHTWLNVNRDSPIFDARATVPCIGTLPRVAAFRPDAVRTLHPTHSLAIFGRGAAEYAKGEEHSATPAPVGGCLSRLYEEGGKILLIGVGHESNTYLHAVDEQLNIPGRLHPEPFTVTIRDRAGKELLSPPYRSHYSPLADISDHYPNYKPLFEHTGAVTYARLGNALVYCCDARKMTDAVHMVWEKTDHDLCINDDPIPEEYYRTPGV